MNTATSLSEAPPPYVDAVRSFFDHQYAAHPRYWWQGDNRYSLEPSQHTPFNALVLQIAARRRPGRALDLGAGEGADATGWPSLATRSTRSRSARWPAGRSSASRGRKT